jgi:hypothetical protein
MATAAEARPNYRLIAQSAIDYVKRKMTVGATNKLKDIVSSRGMSLLCVPAERSVTDDASLGRFDHFLRMVAGAAKNTGCGNCGEQAAVAFVYLMDRGVRPLDYIALKRPGATHSWCWDVRRTARTANRIPGPALLCATRGRAKFTIHS